MAPTSWPKVSSPAGWAAPAALAAAMLSPTSFWYFSDAGKIIVLAITVGVRLDVQRLGVRLCEDVEAALQLLFGVDLVLGEQVQRVLAGDDRQHLDGVLQVGQAAPLGLGVPLL